MLTNNEIAENMLNDIDAYRDNIKDIIIARLTDCYRQKVYWDAWYRGAKGKELERADEGKVYEETNLNK